MEANFFQEFMLFRQFQNMMANPNNRNSFSQLSNTFSQPSLVTSGRAPATIQSNPVPAPAPAPATIQSNPAPAPAPAPATIQSKTKKPEKTKKLVNYCKVSKLTYKKWKSIEVNAFFFFFLFIHSIIFFNPF